MKPEVYFIRTKTNERTDIVSEKIAFLFEKADFGKCISEKDLVGIKIHFGDENNNTHIPYTFVRPVVTKIKEKGGNPFLTDTCVLYRSKRDNGVNHLLLAYEHGFTPENVGAPIIIADGLVGREEKEVKIPGKIFDKVSLAPAAIEANALIILTHVTGHIATGMGAAIKNVGMGFASRKGKLRQHSVMKPAISKKYCTGCQTCIKWCPVDAISMRGGVAWIDSEKCVGCGECITVCRFDAVKFDWKVDSSELQKRIAEHALGVAVEKPGKIGYINFLMSVTKDCDCLAVKQEPIIPDIGILASKDPVAVDAASLNLIRENIGKTLPEISYSNVDPWAQIRHGEEIGLGSADYKLVKL